MSEDEETEGRRARGEGLGGEGPSTARTPQQLLTGTGIT